MGVKIREEWMVFIVINALFGKTNDVQHQMISRSLFLVSMNQHQLPIIVLNHRVSHQAPTKLDCNGFQVGDYEMSGAQK